MRIEKQRKLRRMSVSMGLSLEQVEKMIGDNVPSKKKETNVKGKRDEIAEDERSDVGDDSGGNSDDESTEDNSARLKRKQEEGSKSAQKKAPAPRNIRRELQDKRRVNVNAKVKELNQALDERHNLIQRTLRK